MKALTYHGSKDVRVENVPDPTLQQSDDIILKVTATAICGSDLHLYRGKIPQVKDGDIFGHEFMGIVEEVGKAVTAVKKGGRVVVPFVIASCSCIAAAVVGPNSFRSIASRNYYFPSVALERSR